MDTPTNNARTLLDQMTVLQWTQETSLKEDMYEADDREIQTEDVIGSVELVQSIAGKSADSLLAYAPHSESASLLSGLIVSASGEPEDTSALSAGISATGPLGLLAAGLIGNDLAGNQTLLNPTLPGNGNHGLINAALNSMDDNNPLQPDAPPESTNPDDPNNPGDPTDPSDPTDPGDPTDPTDPGDPTDPTDPGNPTDPTDPGDPGDPTDPTDPSDHCGPTDPGDPGDPNDPCGPEEPTDDDCGCGNSHIDVDVNAIVDVVLGPLPDILSAPILTVDGSLTPILNIDLGAGCLLPDSLGLDLGLIQNLDIDILNTLSISEALSALITLDAPLTLEGLIHDGLSLAADVDLSIDAGLDFAHTQTLSILAHVDAVADACISEGVGVTADAVLDLTGTIATQLGLDAVAEVTASVDLLVDTVICLQSEITADVTAHVDTVLEIATDASALLTTALDLGLSLSLEDGLTLNAELLNSLDVTANALIESTTTLAVDIVADASAWVGVAVDATADTTLDVVAGIGTGLGITALTDIVANADITVDTALQVVADVQASVTALIENTTEIATGLTTTLDTALSLTTVLSPDEGLSLCIVPELAGDLAANLNVSESLGLLGDITANAAFSLHALIDAVVDTTIGAVANITEPLCIDAVDNLLTSVNATADTATDIVFGLAAGVDLLGNLGTATPEGQTLALSAIGEWLGDSLNDPASLLSVGELFTPLQLEGGATHEILSGGLVGTVVGITSDAGNLLSASDGDDLTSLLTATLDTTLESVTSLTGLLSGNESVYWNDSGIGTTVAETLSGWLDTVTSGDATTAVQALTAPVESWLTATIQPVTTTASQTVESLLTGSGNENHLTGALTETVNSVTSTVSTVLQPVQPVTQLLSSLGSGLKNGFGW